LPYYNDTVADNVGNNEHVPTGCAATAMAIKMRFHEHPTYGHGSHAYYDECDGEEHYHSVSFWSHLYDWSDMPKEEVTSTNQDVADLMYHCGVAIEMDYEECLSTKWPDGDDWDAYFYYEGTEEIWDNHEDTIKTSIKGGLPVVFSNEGHVVLADGYRDTEAMHFHLNHA